jgi:hypothetical protein
METIMNRTFTTTAASLLMFASQSLLADARVAVAHFAPFAEDIEDTAVDIAVNGVVNLPGVKFKEFTEYLDFPAGDYTIDVYLAGLAGSSDPIISGDFTLEDGVSYTLFATGNAVTQTPVLLALVDTVDAPDAGNLNLRVVHAAPFAADLEATEVSIRTADGTVVNGLEGVAYGQNSPFFQIPADTYDLKVASNDGSVNYIDILPVPLPAGADVTVFAIGDGINLPLSVVAFPVGELETRTPVDNRSNGWWQVLEGEGVGFILQPMPAQNRLVGTWYQYDDMGNPTFFTFDSCLEESNDMGEFECSTPGAFDGVMATTTLTLTTGGGTGDGAMAVRQKLGEIDFEILGCEDALATVRLEGADPAIYTAKQLTRPFPCTDEQ